MGKYKVSLKEKIVAYLKRRTGQWVNGGQIENLAMVEGYKASCASRRARELVHEKIKGGVINKKFDVKGSVWYRFIPAT